MPTSVKPGAQRLLPSAGGGGAARALRDRREHDRPAVLSGGPLDQRVRGRRRRRLLGQRSSGRTRSVASRCRSSGGGASAPVPVLSGTEAWVSARVFAADPLLPFVARIATAPASAAMIRSPRTGQIQSPGYRENRRRQAVASTGMTPRWTGSRSPHSRQYSWNGSYGVPQRGHSPPSSTGAGGGPDCSSGGSGGRATQLSQGSPDFSACSACWYIVCASSCPLPSLGRSRHGGSAVRAELRVGRKCVAAVGAGDDRLFADRASAVGAEVRAPLDRSAAGAAVPDAFAPLRDGDLEQFVDLAEPAPRSRSPPGIARSAGPA